MRKVGIYLFFLFWINLGMQAQKNIDCYVAKPISVSNRGEVLASKLFNEFFEVINDTIKAHTSNFIYFENDDRLKKQGFCVSKRGSHLYVKAKGFEMLSFAAQFLFERSKSNPSYFNKLTIDCQYPDFEYRHPYFYSFEDYRTSVKNKVHTIDGFWGVWGHNLDKIVASVPHTDGVYATIYGKNNRSQFCFSSEELQKIVSDKVWFLGEGLSYVIAPKDNSLVCTCHKCKSLGNTKTDASPAVFYFLNRIAKSFTKTNFFTIVYNTVKTVPSNVKTNVGVFLSTINYQKAVSIEKSDMKKSFEKEVIKWTTTFDNVYIWDYILNYDNYNDFFPILNTTKDNLVFYKKLGVNGVFFNGGETYALLEDLKYHILSKLLWDTSINVEQEIFSYFKNNYPASISGYLASYYNRIETLAHKSKFKASIYSGVSTAKKKYLVEAEFKLFYKQIAKAYNQLNNPDQKTSRLFLALSLLRLDCFKHHMISTICNPSKKKEIIDLIKKVQQLSQSTKVFVKNESNIKISTYVSQWSNTILNYPFESVIEKVSIKSLSKLDPSYNTIEILNDGNFGFKDNYHTNWLQFSNEQLEFEIINISLQKGDELNFSFLNNPKHRISLPKKISVFYQGKEIQHLLLPSTEITGTYRFKFPIDIAINNKSLKIVIKKKNTHNSRTFACDEVFIKRLINEK